MLNHSVIGPKADGSFLVVYPTPGCCAMTVACLCKSQHQALIEADRLNDEQIKREKKIRWERELRGLGGVYPVLDAFDIEMNK